MTKEKKPKKSSTVESTKKPKKPIYKRWWFWLIVVFIFAVLFVPSKGVKETDPGEKPAPTATTEPTAEPLPEEPSGPYANLKMNTGTIEDVKQNGSILVVKARVNQLMNNKQTIDQNYYNACEIIRSLGDLDVSELQYWAITENNGEDIKIISFTVPSDVIATVKGSTATTFADNSLGDIVTDLWILPALQS